MTNDDMTNDDMTNDDVVMHRGIERAAERFGDRDAVLFGDERWSYAELDARSNSFARHLATRGVNPGQRVAMMLTNRPEFVVAVNGISKLGAAAVLFSPAWKAFEVDHALDLTEPVHAVADGAAAALLVERLARDAVTDLDDASLLDAALTHDRARVSEDVRETDEAVLVFSSGTTGLPKAVRHTHRSIGVATTHWCDALGLCPDDRFQIATPPSHILGLLNLLAAASAGAVVRLHKRFDLDEVLRRIASDRMTLEMAVAPIALAMANHPRLEDCDLSSLRYIMWGATPVTEAVARTVTDRTGVRWLPAYGASEVPVIAANPVNDPSSWRLDSAGLPPTGVELRVVDLDRGDVVPAGQIGEIQVKSPSVMAGYLPDQASCDAFADGWYRTGDVGWLEAEGWVHLTDRSKEMIKVNGFQVAPAEVEAVLHSHPAVLDCAVFGLPDERAGEVPVAAVQLDPDRPVSTKELEQLVAGTLATYKRLHHVVVVDAIPRLPSGKVLRRMLRDAWTPSLLTSGTNA
jgi:acyl-CoA synthetase (AMP-forming)/AMP-acid ligase II